MVKVKQHGETLILRGDRTLFWPSRSVLLAADLHLGKSETMQAHGLPVPSGGDLNDLNRLTSALQDTGAMHLILLGDLIHHRTGLTLDVQRMFAAWQAHTKTTQVTLIRGNHDRYLNQLPHGWDLKIVDEALILPPFCFRHYPEPHPDHYVFAGHLHPVVRLQGGGDSMRLPCFELGPDVGVLPAFSSFAGGYRVRPETRTRHFAITDEIVVPLAKI